MTTQSATRQRMLAALLACACWLGGTAALAQPPAADAVIEALRDGGYVLVMRHAHAPRTAPAANAADPRNVDLERELDDTGRSSAAAMGRALKALAIPIGEVLTSPTLRAVQTVEQLALDAPIKPIAELGDGGQGMAADAAGRRSAWLRDAAANAPADGPNTLLVTHVPNLEGAFGDEAAGMADGETLILRPADGSVAAVGRVRIEEWPALAGVEP